MKLPRRTGSRRFDAALTVHGLGSRRKGRKASEYKQVADMLHAVMESDRDHLHAQVSSTGLQNERQGHQGERAYHEDKKALPLPAQMFRFGAEMVATKTKVLVFAAVAVAGQQAECPAHQG